MTKPELIAAVQKELGCETNTEAAVAYNAVISVIGKQIQKGAKAIKKPTKAEGSVKASTVLTISGLGSFKVSASPARKGRNPLDGSTVNVKAKKRVSFKAADNFKV